MSSSKHTSAHHELCIFFPCSANGSSLSCVTDAFDGNVTSGNASDNAGGPVVVFVDNAVIDMTGVEFEFRGDQVYTRVNPRRVIPA